MRRRYSAVENTYNCFSWCFSQSNSLHFFISSLSCPERKIHSKFSNTGTAFATCFGSSTWYAFDFFGFGTTFKLLILKRVMKFNHKNRTHTHTAALIMTLLSRLVLPTKLISFLWYFFFLDLFFCFEYQPKFLLHFLYSAIFFGYNSLFISLS